jgi:hypothetical protein
MHDATELQIRRQAWWPMLCGAFGQVFGNDPLFWFGPGWRAELDSPGTRAMRVWRDFWEPLPWWRLVPDVRGELVRGWRGAVAGLERLTAARTAQGDLAVVYVPAARSIEVDLGSMIGPAVHATWFDPTSGATVDARRHPASGVLMLPSPFPEDAALLLRSVDAR